MRHLILVLAIFGCQRGRAPQADQVTAPGGVRRYGPVALDEVSPRMMVPRGARLLQGAAKRGDAEVVTAAYCFDDATVDAVTDEVSAQLAADAWRSIATKSLSEDGKPWKLVTGQDERGLRTSVEVMTAAEPGCEAPASVAVGVSVYRIVDNG